MLTTVASKMARHCNSPHQITPLRLQLIAQAPGTPWLLLKGIFKTQLTAKASELIRNGDEKEQGLHWQARHLCIWQSLQYELPVLWCAFNPVDSTYLQLRSTLGSTCPYTWISLQRNSRCEPFAGCMHSNMSLFGNSQGHGCIVQHATCFCTWI